jgi:glycosyltransferase involved in cell wall biosynthesis
MDQYGMVENGTTTTAMQLASKMREKGHTVRIVTCIRNDDEVGIYLVKERHFPLITPIIHSHGMVLAKPDKKVLEAAFSGADLVHFFMPFKLAKVGKTLCDRLGIASTAAFHVQPENITYNIGLRKLEFVNQWIYGLYKKFFDRFAHVHVPSQMVRGLLAEHGYASTVHPVSNGVRDVFFTAPKSERPAELNDRFVVMMCGRFGREKRQDILIKAAAKSKYSDKIQVVLCGKGPCGAKLQSLGEKLLKNPPVLKFCNREELIKTIDSADLYVHTGEIECEAIACMEAFVRGLVPLISDAKYSATKQFALHEQNIFQSGNTDELAQKIDWFIEHPAEKAAMQKEYLAIAPNYTLDKCVGQMEQIFIKAVEENRKRVQNIAAEKNYLSDLTEKDIRRYRKEKLAYQERALMEGQPDYDEEYIRTVLPEAAE